MATANVKIPCYSCQKDTRTFICQGCSQSFCLEDLTKHIQELNKNFEEIETSHEQFGQLINDRKQNPNYDSLMKQIDQWEKQSVNKIKQVAENCREKLINFTNGCLSKFESKLNNLVRELKEIRDQDKFNEIDLNQMKTRLNKLNEEFDEPKDISIQQKPSTFIQQIFVQIREDRKWKQQGVTMIGPNQLHGPRGIFIDDHQNMFIADYGHHRIIEWKLNSTNDQIITHGNENQLNEPTDVIIDKEDNCLIIADSENRRIMKWSRQNESDEQILVSNIDCENLTMDRDGSLYISEWKKNEVRRQKIGDEEGTIVAGGNGEGDAVNQLNGPTFIFVDEDYTLFVSDTENNRVMKWEKDAKEGVVVAGGNGRGNRLTQLSSPRGLIVDQLGQIYVADCDNNRVIRWCEGHEEGTVVVGGNGKGRQANQLDGPVGLSFDEQGNLYVADCRNLRIQKFEMI